MVGGESVDWKPRVAIAGAGGMDALFGAILQSGGLSVKLIDIDARHGQMIKERGLWLTGFGGNRTDRNLANCPMKARGRS